MTDAVYRQWLLLRRIPREPRRLSTRELWDKLRSEGYEITKRTVERDLNALSAQFGFTSETQGATTFWFWPKDAAALDVSGLEPAGALAVVLAHEHLEPLLPTSALESLALYLYRAREVLDQQAGHRLGSWRKKVRTLTRGPVLQKPKVVAAVHAAVTDALLRERRIEATYRGRQADEHTEFTLNPLGLVAKDGVLYLIATAWNLDTPFQYALHRFTKAHVIEEPARRLAGFSLAHYIDEEAAFGYPESLTPITLVADFDADTCAHLRERPLSSDQMLADQPDGRVRLRAIVRDTQELRWWLLGFGQSVEVISPLGLRKEFRRTAKRMTGRYLRRSKA